MGQSWFQFAVLLGVQLVVLWAAAAETYVTCLVCPDVGSPKDCRQSVTCGSGEICFARKVTDHRGLQGFRLGCESEARCNIYLNAKKLFGKRDVSDPVPPDTCYECCSGDECNGGLCQGQGGAHVPPTLSTTDVLSCSCPQSNSPVCPNVCPFNFVPYKDRCYYFTTWNETWDNAKLFCERLGAYLVSINTQEEQEYLVKELQQLGIKGQFVWTGGAYTHSLHMWEWADLTHVLYTNWDSGHPGTPSLGTNYHIGMNNPTNGSETKKGKWQDLTTESYRFICEKPKALTL